MKNKEATLFSKGKIRLLCVGDSHTYGIGAEKGLSYPDQLQRMLDKEMGGEYVQVFNAGRPGFNTAMLAQRFNSLLYNFSPQAVIVMSGDNDFWNFEDVFAAQDSWPEKIDEALGNLRSYRLLKIIAVNLKNQPVLKKLYENYGFEQNHRDNAQKHNDEAIFKPIGEYTLGLKEARLYKLQGEYRKALLLLFHVRCLEFLPETVYQELDDLFITWGDYDEAIAFCSALKEIFPKDPAVDLRLGQLYKRVRDYRKSKECFSAVLNVQPDCVEARTGVSNAERFLALALSRDYVRSYQQYRETLVNESAAVSDPVVKLDDEDSLRMINFLGMSRNKINSLSIPERENLLRVLYKRQLRRICMLAKKRHIKLFFLSYPTFVRNYMLQAINDEHVDFIDVRPAFDKILEKDNVGTYFIPDGHCTAAGYRIIAETVCQKMVNYFAATPSSASGQ
ncbi:MAG: GDSL-type esterase/lipase family protein [Candidatus Omnitrophica bacterium]|nr:GDSL-type esterase/lipase family protein [Candidatus Omnitrophota bacterium]